MRVYHSGNQSLRLAAIAIVIILSLVCNRGDCMGPDMPRDGLGVESGALRAIAWSDSESAREMAQNGIEVVQNGALRAVSWSDSESARKMAQNGVEVVQDGALRAVPWSDSRPARKTAQNGVEVVQNGALRSAWLLASQLQGLRL